MHMWFWFGTELPDFLFYGYDVKTIWGFTSTCLGLAALAIMYEAMKLIQVKLRDLVKKQSQPPSNCPTTDCSSLLSRVSERSTGIFKSLHNHMWAKWLAEVLHWSLHVTLGYLLMLSVMTYNGYIVFAIVIGSGIGYYIFGPLWFEWNISKIQRKKRLIQCNPECTDAITDPITNELASTSDNAEEVNLNTEVEIHYKDET